MRQFPGSYEDRQEQKVDEEVAWQLTHKRFVAKWATAASLAVVFAAAASMLIVAVAFAVWLTK